MISVLCCTLLVTGVPSDAELVLAELGLPTAAGRGVQLTPAYLPDDVGKLQILQTPDRYPLRAAVLQAADALSASHRLKPIVEVRQANLEPAKRAILDFQRSLASAILHLNEASQNLHRLSTQKNLESSLRWRTHFDYIDAAIRLRIGMLEELNLNYGRLHRGELPELATSAQHPGWRLCPAESMISSGSVRKLVEDARADLKYLAAAHPGTPWAALAEQNLAIKPGLTWESANLPAPPPVRSEPRRRPKP